MKIDQCCFIAICLATGLWCASISSAQDSQRYQIEVIPKEHVDVVLGNKKLVRFVNQPHDGTDPNSHYLTYKPFHQVFDPDTGTVLLSSGAHPKSERAEFPHHRGIFFGFNKITYDNKRADNWHCNDGSFTTCEAIVDQHADQSKASYTAVIGWHGADGEKFAQEYRTISVTQYPNSKAGRMSTQIDWSTKLMPLVNSVKLDGDPQHAGFHFRANQEVALKNAKQTYFVRPDGKGQPGETRNWDAQNKDPQTIDVPWSAMCFVVGDEEYSVVRMSSPENPRPTRGSERDYGRFGDYFEFEVTPEKPLELKYRLVVSKQGEYSDYYQRLYESWIKGE
jgi:hypothetical protein